MCDSMPRRTPAKCRYEIPYIKFISIQKLFNHTIGSIHQQSTISLQFSATNYFNLQRAIQALWIIVRFSDRLFVDFVKLQRVLIMYNIDYD